MLLILLSLGCHAQQHLTFMEIQMGGNFDTFIQSMIGKDLQVSHKGSHLYGTDDDEDWCYLSGQFWKFGGVDILVKAPYIDGGVTFVNVSSCRADKETYNLLISQMNRKYGRQITNLNVRYTNDRECIWKTSKGNVIVWRSMFSTDDMKCNIEIEYQDFPYVKRKEKTKKPFRNSDL